MYRASTEPSLVSAGQTGRRARPPRRDSTLGRLFTGSPGVKTERAVGRGRWNDPHPADRSVRASRRPRGREHPIPDVDGRVERFPFRDERQRDGYDLPLLIEFVT